MRTRKDETTGRSSSNPVTTLDDACRRLFGSFPLDIIPGEGMLVFTAESGKYHYLARLENGWQMWPWNDTGDGVLITKSTESIPGEYADALPRGVPVPRAESVFGWVADGTVTAVILVYTDPGTGIPEPCFSVMPAADCTGDHWPACAEESRFGSWIWEHLAAGKIVDLTSAITSTKDTVLWSTAEITGGGAGVIAVREPVRTDCGWTLPAGVYAYHEVLRAGQRIPSLPEVLAVPGNTDLATWFR